MIAKKKREIYKAPFWLFIVFFFSYYPQKTLRKLETYQKCVSLQVKVALRDTQ